MTLPRSKAEKAAALRVLEAAESSTDDDVEMVLGDLVDAIIEQRYLRTQYTILVIPKDRYLTRTIGVFPTKASAAKFVNGGRLAALHDEKYLVIPHYPNKEVSDATG